MVNYYTNHLFCSLPSPFSNLTFHTTRLQHRLVALNTTANVVLASSLHNPMLIRDEVLELLACIRQTDTIQNFGIDLFVNIFNLI